MDIYLCNKGKKLCIGMICQIWKKVSGIYVPRIQKALESLEHNSRN